MFPVRSLSLWLVALLAASSLAAEPANGARKSPRTARATATSTSEFRYRKLSSPSRTVVTDRSGARVATLTAGSRSVLLAGPARVFTERTAASPVRTTGWVRLLDRPFSGTVDESWLRRALADTSPDVLAIAAQYVEGAPDLLDGTGARVAGDADYGPLLADGTRQEGADFNDFLGVRWTYGDTVDSPETAQLGALDCSGFVRMVFGRRSGLPLTLVPDGAGLPRRAVQMLDSAPGIVPVRDSGAQVTSFAALQQGDLVFFDAAADDGTAVDHVGIYLGLDAAGSHRFISSRKSINGPTLGDYAGRSTLDGTGLYARSFRATRRL